MLELINAFFTLAKLEAGDMRMERTKVNLSELCRENVLGFYELLLQKEFTVDISIPEDNLFVWGDRDSIDRILTNLLSNAILTRSDMAATENISGLRCAVKGGLCILMLRIRERGLIRRLRQVCLSGFIQWRIRATGRYKGTVWV